MEMVISFPGGVRVDAQFGAQPFATFLASIGTCAGICVLGFCRQRGLPPDGICLVQQLGADPATGMIASIGLEIHVPPGFPEKYHAVLVRSAEPCAVKKLIEPTPRFEIRTVA